MDRNRITLKNVITTTVGVSTSDRYIRKQQLCWSTASKLHAATANFVSICVNVTLDIFPNWDGVRSRCVCARMCYLSLALKLWCL